MFIWLIQSGNGPWKLARDRRFLWIRSMGWGCKECGLCLPHEGVSYGWTSSMSALQPRRYPRTFRDLSGVIWWSNRNWTGCWNLTSSITRAAPSSPAMGASDFATLRQEPPKSGSNGQNCWKEHRATFRCDMIVSGPARNMERRLERLLESQDNWQHHRTLGM